MIDRPILVVAWAALGWIIGLFATRVAYALPSEQPLRALPRCGTCDAPFKLLAWPRRACRICGSPLVSDRLEWPAGLLFGLLAAKFALGGSLVAYSVYSIALLITADIDLRHRYIYSVVSVPACIAAVILSPTLIGIDLVSTLLGLGIAFGVFLLFYLAGRLIYRQNEPVGKGDLELAAVIGAMVGFPRVLSALFLGSVVNGVVIGALLISGRRGRMDFVPYGPGLCVGAFTAFFIST